MKNFQMTQTVFHRFTLLLAVIILMPSSINAAYWRTTQWLVQCVEPVDCEPANLVFAEQLSKASVWLRDLDFEEAASFNNLDLGDDSLKHWIASISDSRVDQEEHSLAGFFEPVERMIWLRNENYFNLGDAGQSYDDPFFAVAHLNTFVAAHELFHAVQSAENYSVPLDQQHKWISEGTATAVAMDFALETEPELGAQFLMREHKSPLHQPAKFYDNYKTAHFWLFIGKQLNSKPRIAYLNEFFLNHKLTDHYGIAGLDAYLKPQGGLYTLFPLYLAELPVLNAFGQPDTWQLKLPNNKQSISQSFTGRVRKLAGSAAQLTVSHSSDKDVELSIEISENPSDLHLIIDGAVQATHTAGNHAIYRAQLTARKKDFSVVIAEVAKNAIDSVDRHFKIKVTLKEITDPPCGFKAVVTGGVPMAGVHQGPARFLGNMMILNDLKTGWEARVALPAKAVGKYTSSFQAAAFKVDHPDCPGCVEFWQSDEAAMEIKAFNTDRKNGFVVGNFSGQAKWTGLGSTGEYTPFQVNVSEFRAVARSTRNKSAFESCVNHWKNR